MLGLGSVLTAEKKTFSCFFKKFFSKKDRPVRLLAEFRVCRCGLWELDV